MPPRHDPCAKGASRLLDDSPLHVDRGRSGSRDKGVVRGRKGAPQSVLDSRSDRPRAVGERGIPDEQFWSDRSAAAAKLCRSGQWVCDIGCGIQRLAAALPPGCVYLPADLHRLDPAVDSCDLNAGLLPGRHLARCDVVTLLGVIEYIFDPLRLLSALAQRAEIVVLSYNSVELADVDRAGFGW